MTFTIEELVIPRTLADPTGADFVTMTTVRNAVEAEIVGSDDLSTTPEELLPHWHDEYAPKRLLLARVDGRIVGRGVYEVQTEGSANAAWLNVAVLSSHRRRGIGTALLTGIEALADADGRATRQIFAVAPEVAGQRIPAPTGFGSLPVASEGVQFLIKHEYSLEQVVRFSRLTLPVPESRLNDLMAEAASAAGPDYRVHTWSGRTPEPWLADMALLLTRMSTDAPVASLDIGEDTWTPERIREYEQRQEASPRTEIFAAIEHLPSARLVGFTGMSVPEETERAVTQEDTIVLKEHRGHRLGMLLKLANIANLTTVAPGHPSITTFNAEENQHMLAVNEAVGFTPVGYDGAWKKVAEPHDD